MSLKVNLQALGIDGTTPEIGNQIEAVVSGTVTAIEGESASIDITQLNGLPAQDEGGNTESTEMELNEEEIRNQAKKYDDEENYINE